MPELGFEPIVDVVEAGVRDDAKANLPALQVTLPLRIRKLEGKQHAKSDCNRKYTCAECEVQATPATAPSGDAFDEIGIAQARSPVSALSFRVGNLGRLSHVRQP